MEKKYFTLEEANDLIPTLEYKLPKLLRVKRELAALVSDLYNQGIHAEDLFENEEISDPALVNVRAKLEELGAALTEGLSDVQSHGCLVKDIDLGLIDFYGLIGNEEVFFCWQLGEKEINYWHKTTEGFSARRPLGEEEEGPADKMYH